MSSRRRAMKLAKVLLPPSMLLTLVLALTLGLSIVQAEPVVQITMEPSSTSANPQHITLNGTQDFDVNIVTNGEEVTGVELLIEFDPTILQVVDQDPLSIGVQILNPVSNPLDDFELANEADNTLGTIFYSVGESTSVSVDFTVATITFESTGTTMPLATTSEVVFIVDSLAVQSTTVSNGGDSVLANTEDFTGAWVRVPDRVAEINLLPDTSPGAPLVLTVGDTTDLTVEVNTNGEEANVVSLVMEFDSAVLAVVDADLGEPGVQIMPVASPWNDFTLDNEADNTLGTIVYTIGDATPASGTFNIAIITFEALVPTATAHLVGDPTEVVFLVDGGNETIVTIEGAQLLNTTSDYTDAWIEILPVPETIAQFTFDPEPANEGDSVNFDGSGSTSGNGVLTFDWSFGDGSSFIDAGEIINHTYADNGIYSVSLTVNDEGGGSDTVIQDVTVLNVAPDVVAAAASDHIVNEGETYLLKELSFSDPGYDCPACVPPTVEDFTAEINWGDGTIEPGDVTEFPGSEGVDTTGTVDGDHVYADNGLFIVTVTVTDDDGGFDSFGYVVTVLNVAPTVEAGPSQIVNVVDVGQTVSLAPSTFSDPGFTCGTCIPATAETFGASINWDDGTVEPGTVNVTPGSSGVPTTGTVDGSHEYDAIGVYTVTVTVTDDDFGDGSDTLTVTVAEEVELPAVPIQIRVGPPDVEPNDHVVGVGVDFYAEIWVMPVDKTVPIEAASAFINFDSELFEFIDIVPNLEELDFAIIFTGDNNLGQVDYTAITLGDAAMGDFLIATVHFTVESDLVLTDRIETTLSLDFTTPRETAVGGIIDEIPVAVEGIAKEGNLEISTLVFNGHVESLGALPPPSTRHVLMLTVTFINAGGSDQAGTTTAVFDSVISDKNGDFVVDLEGTYVVPDTYDIRVKDNGSLSNLGLGISIPVATPDQPIDFGSLIPGDLDNDNDGDIFDLLTTVLGLNQAGD